MVLRGGAQLLSGSLGGLPPIVGGHSEQTNTTAFYTFTETIDFNGQST